jgi:transposase
MSAKIKSWTIREAKLVLEWAKRPKTERSPFDELAGSISRTPAAVREFLRRVLPRGKWPWTERPRWQTEEVEAVRNGVRHEVERSRSAVQKFVRRHGLSTNVQRNTPEEAEHCVLTVSQVASDLGVSRATVYRFLQRGFLRRFKGGIAETSFADLLRKHPDAIPYARLPRENKEWLVLNGYFDPSLPVKRPTTTGWLE